MYYQRIFWLVRMMLAGLLAVELAGQAGYLPSIDERIWPGLLFMSVISWAALELSDGWMRRSGLPRLPVLAVLVGLAVVYVDAVGNIAGWYASITRFDVLVHAASGLAVTVALFYVVANVAKARDMNIGPGGWAYIAWTTMLTLAVLFELGEWVADLVLGGVFWLGSAQDTLTDLLAAMGGGAAGLTVVWKWRRRRQ